MFNFSPFDFICAGLIVIFAVRCALRGFISELLSMAAIVFGMLASLFFFKKGGAYLCEKFMPGYPVVAEVLAFILLFLIVFIMAKILENLLKGIIEGIRLGGVDRFLGIIFGFIEGLIVVGLVLFIISVQPLFDPGELLNNSFFAGIIMPLITGGAGKALDTALQFVPCMYKVCPYV